MSRDNVASLGEGVIRVHPGSRWSVMSPIRNSDFWTNVGGDAVSAQFSLRTEEAYVDWIRRFIAWNDRRHPREMGANEVRAFLSYLAAERRVGPSTQNQALCALIFTHFMKKPGLGVRSSLDTP